MLAEEPKKISLVEDKVQKLDSEGILIVATSEDVTSFTSEDEIREHLEERVSKIKQIKQISLINCQLNYESC